MIDHTFRLKRRRKKVNTIHEILTMVESYVVLEEKLNTHFGNPTTVKAHSSLQLERSHVDSKKNLNRVCKGGMTSKPL